MRPGSGSATIVQLNRPDVVDAADAADAVESELRALGLPVTRSEETDASGFLKTVTLRWSEGDGR